MNFFSKLNPVSKKEKWLRIYARLGLAAHGLVYCLMSILCFMTALGYRKKQNDKSEAFKLIYDQPFGRGILFIIGICLLGYVTLRLFQAIKDTRHKGKSLNAILKRITYASIAITYSAMSYYCFKMAIDKPEGGSSRKLYILKLFNLPYGEWIVAAIGICFAAAAVYQIHRGISQKFMKHVDLHNSDYQKTFIVFGTIGYVAKGIVFAIIAYLFVRAAYEVDAHKAEGANGAFKFLQATFGNTLLGILALGLLTFGFFLFVRAKHEKMNFDIGK